MKVASISQVREIEAAADRSLLSYEQMMQNAGAAASEFLQRRYPIEASSKITFLIGKGNNGGDGLVMAHELALATGAVIRLYLLEARDSADKNYQALQNLGLAVALASEDHDCQELSDLIMSADIIVDAVFGIGLRLPLRGPAAKVLGAANESLRARAMSENRRPVILAIDCPSGIDCDTGQADAQVIRADATISFIAGKRGFYTFPAAGYVGDLEIAAIGIPGCLPELDRLKATVMDEKCASSLLPERPLDGHKGTFGKVMIVAGSQHYIGAIALAGESAYRSGAGLATIATISRLTEVIAGVLREPTWLPLPEAEGAIAESATDLIIEGSDNYDALLVGCGLGTGPSTGAFLRRLMGAPALPALALDADALNILSQDPGWWEDLPADTIITPHAGELARLTGLSAKEINANRWKTARQYAEAWNLVLLLKGAHTLVAAPDGRISVLPFKSDALSTAGSGDVLAGLIGGLRAQGLSAFDSARLGAFVHASAGLIAAHSVGSSRSVIASDLLSAVGSAFAGLESI